MDSTYLIIAHRNFVSYFNVLTNRWVKHTRINCGTDVFIRKFFQLNNADGATEIMLLMNDNDFYKIEGDIINLVLDDIPDEVNENHKLFRIDGTISDCAIDYKTQSYAFFIHHHDEEKTQCKLLFKGELHDVTDFGEISSQTNLVPVQLEDEEKMYVF